MQNKRIAIVGSGVAGLCAARHCSVDNNITCVVYEQASAIGGTWVYTDEVDLDKYGLPVHSSMYQGLRTNLPKEAMSYPDFPHTNTDDISYLPSQNVLKYINDYAKHFGLQKYIKFNHHVKMIEPIDNNQWEVTVVDVKTKEERTEYFDGVMLCTGFNSIPRFPELPNCSVFEGKKIHSHQYREPGPYAGLNVLVIGAGPSGLDLTCELAKSANKVYLSHHTDYAGKLEFAENVNLKPDVLTLTPDSVIFKDNTEYKIDVIMYCTGYLIKFKFLSEKCKIEVEDNFVKPLYRHLISIEHPSLCVVGLPNHLPIFHLCHIQTQFYLKALMGKIQLPNKEEMYKELNEFIQIKLNKGIRMRDFTTLGNNMEKYYNDLADKAGVEKMSISFATMYKDAYDRIFKDFMTFRSMSYKIIDDERYVVDMRKLKSISIKNI